MAEQKFRVSLVKRGGEGRDFKAFLFISTRGGEGFYDHIIK